MSVSNGQTMEWIHLALMFGVVHCFNNCAETVDVENKESGEIMKFKLLEKDTNDGWIRVSFELCKSACSYSWEGREGVYCFPHTTVPDDNLKCCFHKTGVVGTGQSADGCGAFDGEKYGSKFKVLNSSCEGNHKGEINGADEGTKCSLECYTVLQNQWNSSRTFECKNRKWVTESDGKTIPEFVKDVCPKEDWSNLQPPTVAGGCSTDIDCSNNLNDHYCHVTRSKCVECSESVHCNGRSDGKTLCHPTKNICVGGCIDDEDCSNNHDDHYCHNSMCVECHENANCKDASKSRCSSNECVVPDGDIGNRNIEAPTFKDSSLPKAEDPVEKEKKEEGEEDYGGEEEGEYDDGILEDKQKKETIVNLPAKRAGGGKEIGDEEVYGGEEEGEYDDGIEEDEFEDDFVPREFNFQEVSLSEDRVQYNR